MTDDLIIVGGGPAGLYAAFYAGLRNLRVTLLEADQELGGRLRYYPEKLVWDVGGLPPTPGEQLRSHLEAQARTFEPRLVTGSRVVGAEYLGGRWHLEDEGGRSYRARALVLALGAGTLGTRRLEVPGAAEAEGRGLYYSLRDPGAFAGRSVVISGGGNSAVDWAHQLAPVASRVTLVHRRAEFRAHERVVAGLTEAGVEVLVPSRVAAVGASGGALAWVDLEDLAGGGPQTLETEALLVGHGLDFQAGTGLLALEGRPGVFCCGDCVRRPGKAYLMASTFPEAAEAVNAAMEWLAPGSEAQAMVSSHHPVLSGRSAP